MSVSGSISAQFNDFSAQSAQQTRRQAPDAAVTRQPSAGNDTTPVRIVRQPVTTEPVRLPSPGERTERGSGEERTERPVGRDRFQRLVGKGLRRLTRGVRNELRQLSREFDIDKDTRREIRQSYKSFRLELRDSFRAARADRPIDGNDFASTIRNAFLGLAEEIRAIFDANAGEGAADAGIDSQPNPAPIVTQPDVPEDDAPIAANPGDGEGDIAPTQDPAQPLIYRAVSFVSTFQSVYSRVDQGDGRSESSYSYSRTEFRFEFEVRGTQLEDVA